MGQLASSLGTEDAQVIGKAIVDWQDLRSALDYEA